MPLVLCVTSIAASAVRLPKLTLPSFNGDLLHWNELRYSFSSSFHENHSLTNIQKFAYLRPQLSGKAASCIAGLASTSYTQAINLLKDRFGQTENIAAADFTALMNMKAISGVSPMGLRTFYERVQTHIHGLESLSKSTDRYGDSLSYQLSSSESLPLCISRSLLCMAHQPGHSRTSSTFPTESLTSLSQLLFTIHSHSARKDSHRRFSPPHPTMPNTNLIIWVKNMPATLLSVRFVWVSTSSIPAPSCQLQQRYGRSFKKSAYASTVSVHIPASLNVHQS